MQKRKRPLPNNRPDRLLIKYLREVYPTGPVMVEEIRDATELFDAEVEAALKRQINNGRVIKHDMLTSTGYLKTYELTEDEDLKYNTEEDESDTNI